MSLRLAYYGDDFTGSTDVMEALALAGVPTRLFLAPPSREQLARHPGIEAVGVAGPARSMSPAEMDDHLPPIFRALRELGPGLVHYKICSTFDSSPTAGSIGRAIELGQHEFDSPLVPLLVGAPVLGRYCLFGNLFARSGGESEVFRLDRHPTMSHHPVTPMDEADLRLHLARQTGRPIRLFDVLKLAMTPEQARDALRALAGTDRPIVLFDILTDAHLLAIGRLIAGWMQSAAPLFAAGSSGIEYALTAHWRETGALGPAPQRRTAQPVDRLVAVSGSCSPVTGRQIAHAVERGAVEIALEPGQLLGDEPEQDRLGPIIDRAVRLLGERRVVVIHSCRGPDDPRIGEVRARLASMHEAGSADRPGQALGRVLGRLLRAILQEARPSRAAATGGDTCGYIAAEIGVESLEFVTPVAPGSPLCRVSATTPGSAADGLEISFKGGQVGKVDFFQSVMQGGT